MCDSSYRNVKTPHSFRDTQKQRHNASRSSMFGRGTARFWALFNRQQLDVRTVVVDTESERANHAPILRCFILQKKLKHEQNILILAPFPVVRLFEQGRVCDVAKKFAVFRARESIKKLLTSPACSILTKYLKRYHQLLPALHTRPRRVAVGDRVCIWIFGLSIVVRLYDIMFFVPRA